MYLLTVQYITPHNTLEQMQFLCEQPYMYQEDSFVRFSTIDNVRVQLDPKRVYYATFAPYTPPKPAPTDTADEAKLSE